MDKFINRLKFYLIGFGIGCVMVWAIFYSGEDARSSWLPEGRVLEFIENTTLETNQKTACLLSCYNLSIANFDATFFKKATVNFSESATKRKPCPEYKISGKLLDGRNIIVFIEACEQKRLSKADEKENVATLRDVIFEEETKICNCN